MGNANALELRKRPAQERARRTFDLLLDAAARILDADGLEAFNTNAVAREAGVTAPTLYRYFPNKHAILAALADRYVEDESRWLGDFDGLADPAAELGPALGRMLSGYVAQADAYPAIGPLRAAMRALPALAGPEERALLGASRRLAAALRRRHPRLPRSRSERVARVVVETACSGIDRSRGLSPRERRARLEELRTMLEAYLTELARP